MTRQFILGFALFSVLLFAQESVFPDHLKMVNGLDIHCQILSVDSLNIDLIMDNGEKTISTFEGIKQLTINGLGTVYTNTGGFTYRYAAIDTFLTGRKIKIDLKMERILAERDSNFMHSRHLRAGFYINVFTPNENYQGGFSGVTGSAEIRLTPEASMVMSYSSIKNLPKKSGFRDIFGNSFQWALRYRIGEPTFAGYFQFAYAGVDGKYGNIYSVGFEKRLKKNLYIQFTINYLISIYNRDFSDEKQTHFTFISTGFSFEFIHPRK